MNSPSEWMQRAIDLAVENVRQGLGGPFGAVVVRDGVIVGSGANAVTATNDPTAHAEVMAIRAACRALGTFQLRGCEIYTSCEPCPMCLGAIYWARPERIYFAATRADAAAAGFDDAHIYDELKLDPDERVIPCAQLLRDHAAEAFRAWREAIQRVPY
jgi:tRNA(Arg) A34 adenosine deaminase TadA